MLATSQDAVEAPATTPKAEVGESDEEFSSTRGKVPRVGNTNKRIDSDDLLQRHVHKGDSPRSLPDAEPISAAQEFAEQQAEAAAAEVASIPIPEDEPLIEPLQRSASRAAPPPLPPLSHGRKAALFGLAVYALSTLCTTAMSVTAKMAGSAGMPVMQITLFRGAVVTLFGLPPLIVRGVHPLGNARGLLLFRGVLGWLSGVALYASVQYLPVSDATVLSFLSPVWVALMGPLMLGEVPSRAVWAILLPCIVGVVMVAQPTFIFQESEALNALGVAIACLQAIVSGSVRMVVRALRKTDAPEVVIIYLSVVTLGLSSLLCAVVPGWWVTPKDWQTLGLLLLTGVFAFGNQMSMTWGLRYAAASTCTALSYLSIVWAMLASIFLFHDVPGKLELAGSGIIGACTAALIVFERRKAARMEKAEAAERAALRAGLEGGVMGPAPGTGITGSPAVAPTADQGNGLQQPLLSSNGVA